MSYHDTVVVTEIKTIFLKNCFIRVEEIYFVPLLLYIGLKIN
mgnify:CR=1 FL=1